MKKIIEKLKSLSFGTILRTLLQIIIYINQFVIILGQSPLGVNPVYQWVSFILTIIITGASYWYNNDWTKIAQISEDVYDILKDGKVSKEEVELFISKYKDKKKD